MKILVDLSYVDKDNPTGVSVFALLAFATSVLKATDFSEFPEDASLLHIPFLGLT